MELVPEISLKKLWFLQSKPAPSLAQRSAGSPPVVLCLLLVVSHVQGGGAALLVQELCVKLLVYQAVETGELCGSGLKSLDSRSCQEIEPGGKCSPFLRLAGAPCLSLLLLNTAHAVWQLLFGSAVPVGVQLLAHGSAGPELLWVETGSSHFLLGPDCASLCKNIA